MSGSDQEPAGQLPSRALLHPGPSASALRTLDGFSVSGAPDPLSETDRRLVRVLQETGVPGMVLCVAQGKKRVLERGYGSQIRDGGQGSQPLEPTLPAMLCSLCKPLTAQAVLAVLAEQKIPLTESASRWLLCDPRITLLHLLTHRSGLPARFPDELQAATEAERVRQVISRDALLFAPGQGFAYSNVGYQALGRILERLTGQRPDRAISQRLLEPLGVRSYYVATYLTSPEQARYDSGSAYVLTPQKFDRTTGTYTPVRDRVKGFVRQAPGSNDTCGAGCMSATDYLTFLLSVTPAQRQLVRRLATDGYGPGWILQDGGLAHTGTGTGETHYALTRESGASFVCFLPSSHDEACERVLTVVKSAVKYLT